jgi:hypothetical protein
MSPLRRHGPDAKLPDLLAQITADCERRAVGTPGRCDAVFQRLMKE